MLTHLDIHVHIHDTCSYGKFRAYYYNITVFSHVTTLKFLIIGTRGTHLVRSKDGEAVLVSPAQPCDEAVLRVSLDHLVRLSGSILRHQLALVVDRAYVVSGTRFLRLIPILGTGAAAAAGPFQLSGSGAELDVFG